MEVERERVKGIHFLRQLGCCSVCVVSCFNNSQLGCCSVLSCLRYFTPPRVLRIVQSVFYLHLRIFGNITCNRFARVSGLLA
ncbi:hypothetical protein RchiOBHm_Chr1g0343271 [Rosa chinensis]|uniref:Uncharacterized protein n=1 Tax=Rosa chinensis TaxID=74649 RepID=A0A2P6SE76_ROSCH|nr:hypothetical protein RchiOBHm_Chr1g0343271 [Rosa chinensis]